MFRFRLPIAILFLTSAALAQVTPSAGRLPVLAAGLPLAPMPPDPNEPITSVAQPVTGADRANALALLGRAREAQRLLMPGTPPYTLSATFTSTAGSGNLTQTWMSGQKWRWSGSVGKAEAVRIGAEGTHFGSPNGGDIPPAVHVLRNAIFWAADAVPLGGHTARTSSVVWNGRPTTCMLFPTQPNGEPDSGPRTWDEEEYCVDDANGELQVHSYVPGTYVVYSYSNAPFHGRNLPSGVTIYSGGKKVLDAQVTMTDAGTPDESIFTPTGQMRSWGPVGTGQNPTHQLWLNTSSRVSGEAKPVIVHAAVDAQGTVAAAEVSMSSDPALTQAALDMVKGRPFPPNGNVRQIYIEVRFVPEQ